MAERGERIGLALAGVGLLVAVTSLVLPWWAIELQAGGVSDDATASPFDPGDIPEASIQESAVVAVGVVDLVGLLATTGGLVLWIRARQTGEPATQVAPWLVIAGGALVLIAALAAVATWPADDVEFWDQRGGDNFGVSNAADVGWYLAVVAGASVSAGGFGLMRMKTSEGRPDIELEAVDPVESKDETG